MAKGKHLTVDDRCSIKAGLDAGKSFKEIGKIIGKDCTTVAKEVRFRKQYFPKGAYGQRFNDCANRFGCLENSLCPGMHCRNKRCCRCDRYMCKTELCPRYSKEECQFVNRAPYVCNACGRRNRCTLGKWVYSVAFAQKEYKCILKESRSGIALNKETIGRLDGMLSPLIQKGQSVHHVYVNSNAQAICSERSAYKYINSGLLTAKNIDMPRVVRFRPRKMRPKEIKPEDISKSGRTYEDFQKYLSENNNPHIVEMDTIFGKLGGKCLLTLHFVLTHFMCAYLMDACTARCVSAEFTNLRKVLGQSLFTKLFPVLLGDRGTEFSEPKSIEFDENGEGWTRMFYCDPQMSQQKGSLEVNHEFIRRILPKGTSFDRLSQDKIIFMMNNINSYSRPALNDLTPYAAMSCFFGLDALKKLDAELIPPDKIILRPSLLK